MRGNGTVCGRPLAHTPAPLSTLLTLLMLGSCPPPSTPLCARIISHQNGGDAGGPIPGRAQLPPHPLYLASSCLPTLTASILSLFSPQRGDTKRPLPGRDKPISEMQRGGEPDATRLSFPSSFPLLPSFSHGESHAALGFKHH